MTESAHDVPIIDAHQHFWDLTANYYPWLQDEEPIAFRYGDYSALKRNYLPRTFVATPPLTRSSGPFTSRPNGTAPVRSRRRAGSKDSREKKVFRRRASHMPLSTIRTLAETLQRQAAFPFVRGIRHKPVAANSPGDARRGATGSMDDPQWRRGFAVLGDLGLSFDLQTPWWHLDAAHDLARDFPQTQIVINHTGLPADRSAEGLAAWRRMLEAVASAPNVTIKISGLGQPRRAWTVMENGPVIRDAISIFGPDRSCTRAISPSTASWRPMALSSRDFSLPTADRSPVERRKLLHDNAARIYRL